VLFYVTLKLLLKNHDTRYAPVEIVSQVKIVTRSGYQECCQIHLKSQQSTDRIHRYIYREMNKLILIT